MMESDFTATDLIIPPPEEAWVERLPDGDFRVRWRDPAGRIALYAGVDPERLTAGGRPLTAEEMTSDELRVTNSELAALGERRPYFLLVLDGRRRIVAERTLPLMGGVNFRDLGGYRTVDGRAVRWGQVYRAGSLAELTEDDVVYLDRLGVRLACDLRSLDEVERQPDRLPPEATGLHRPIAAEVNRLRRVVTLFRFRHRVRELLQNVYTVMLDQNGPLFAEVIRLAADPANRPMVIHCTAGKDRTGLAAALLLLALGVPEATVIADYTLSNNAYEVISGRMGPEMERLYAFGFEKAQVRSFFLAEAPTLAGALAHLQRRYGSVEGYLLRSGLDEGALERLRGTLLTADC